MYIEPPRIWICLGGILLRVEVMDVMVLDDALLQWDVRKSGL